MSQENVEIIRRHHEAFISGNRDGAFEPLDPEIEFVFRLFEAPTARGHAEVEEAMRQWIGTWRRGTYRFEASDYRSLGDKVLVRCTEHGLGRGSGVEVRREAFQLWDMRDGKAIRCEVFDREAEALEAAGLRGEARKLTLPTYSNCGEPGSPPLAAPQSARPALRAAHNPMGPARTQR